MPVTLTPGTPPEASFSTDLRGVHYNFLKDQIPNWFTQASAQRQQELASHAAPMPAWYASASPAARQQLAATHRQWRETLNSVEAQLGSLEDLAAFAEPRLKAAIKQQFNLELDVRQVFLARKFTAQGRNSAFDVLVLDRSGTSLNDHYRGVSLLDAALTNFEPGEEQPLPCNDCQIITAWSSYDDEVIPTFAVLAEHAVGITPQAFARLCRSLDLGAQYQAHLKQVLQPADPVKRAALEQQLEQHQHAQLSLASQVATLQRAISADAGAMLQQLLGGQAQVFLDGRPVRLAALQLFGSVLVGPLLIGPERKASGQDERLLVYLPNDPQQPLKEYASSGAFMADLRARLHSVDYRRYFSQFVPAREQGLFFGQFNALYQPADGAGAQLDYPLAARLARLPLDELNLVGNVWEQQRLAHVRKIFADARAIAVPTDDENRQARLARLATFLDAVVNVFNLAAFVVPGLGPLMLTVGMAQMMNDVFEGIQAGEQREWTQMWAHLASVALNVAAIGTGATVIPKVQWLRSVDDLKRVTLASGGQRLWKTDLAPYAREDWQPRSQPDAHGLYREDGVTTLKLDGRYYRVTPDLRVNSYRIQHPQRADAYTPRVRHNGSGAWVHEADQPLSWTGVSLMRRLGPMMEGFSDAQLQQIRRAADMDEGQLRRVLADSAPTPAAWRDSVRRFGAYNDAIKLAEQIRAGKLSSELSWFAAHLMTELPGWPQGRTIEVSYGGSGGVVRYGQATAINGVVPIRHDELMQGGLPARVVEHVSREQLQAMLGQHLPPLPAARAQALNQRLVERAINARASAFDSLYSERVPSSNPAVRQVQQAFPGLPEAMVESLLADASVADRSFVTAKQRVPLGMAEQARALQAQLRLNHAYEGLHLPALAGADTEALLLNTLEVLPGWRNDIRLEVREGSFDGPLRAASGAEGAGQRKVLVHQAPGRYQAFDEQGQALHGAEGVYAALQHALPDTHRQAIGLPHVGQGGQLQALVSDNVLPRDRLRQVLRMLPARKPVWLRPQRLADNRLGYPLSGRGRGQVPVPTQAQIVAIRQRLKTLYPTIDDLQLDDYLLQVDQTNTAWLDELEAEFRALDDLLDDWLNAGPRDAESVAARGEIRDKLCLAWQKGGEWDQDDIGNYRGQRISLEGPDIGAQLTTLPVLPANFDHVSSVHLPDCELSDEGAVFLSTFRRLRILNLERNDLTRLPPVCANMPFMEGLDISDNQIELTDETALHIRNMRQLVWLAAEGNPLGRPLDIGRMPRLRWVYLSGSGLHEWPSGVFATPRPRDFLLDLTGNRLTSIPNVAPGSDRAGILARTVVTQGWLAPDVRASLRLYIESVGMESNRQSPPRGTQESAHWRSGMTQQDWLNKQPTWSDLEEAPGSEPFFNELRKLNENLHARNDAYKADLTAKVWRMLDAMASDSALRERLFEMALAPTTCVDAGAQLFNAMGVEVLLHEAVTLPRPELVQLELLELAKGKARLDELGRIARARVDELLAQGRKFPLYDDDGYLIPQYDANGQQLLSIDEVEIHLAFVSRLADRLDLPWQTAMFYHEPDVTPAMIEAAYTRVLALESGDLLRDGIIEQPFWVDYVQATFAEEFEVVSAKNDALINLLSAQQEWAENGGLSSAQKAQLLSTIDTSAQVLGKTPAQVSPGQVMSDEDYFAEMVSLGDARKNILQAMTDRVMGRAQQAR